MHVVIMGCGRVGSTLATTLEERGHTVSVIDQESDSFRRLGPSFQGETVTGVGFDRGVLMSAGVERADAFAAVSSGDNSNIISARLARETFGVPRVVARIYDSKRADVYERLGIPTVATVRWTADQIVRHVVPDGQLEMWRDPSGVVALREVPVHLGWVGRPVSELESAVGARVGYLVRFGTAQLPGPGTAVQDGDQLFLLLTDETAERVTRIAATGPEGD